MLPKLVEDIIKMSLDIHEFGKLEGTGSGMLELHVLRAQCYALAQLEEVTGCLSTA
jgi:hypothetical protein